MIVTPVPNQTPGSVRDAHHEFAKEQASIIQHIDIGDAGGPDTATSNPGGAVGTGAAWRNITELPQTPDFSSHAMLIDAVEGTVLAVSDRVVEIQINSGLIVEFPKSLFREDVAGLFPGRGINYQVLKRPDGTRFQKFSLLSDPNAEAANQDIFDLWDSITTEK